MSFNPENTLMKATWSGTLGTEEIFVYSRWVTSLTADTDAAAAALSGDVTDLLGTTVTSGPVPTLDTAFPSHIAWTQLKVSEWDPATDKLKALTSPSYVVLTDTPSGSSGAGMPYQCSLGITTRSFRAGRRKYNRFSLPVMTVFVTDGHGVMQASVMNALALWASLNYTARAAAGYVYVNYNPGLPSLGVGQAAGCSPIDDFYMGHRVDTQRRRRNEAPEGRTIQPV